MFNNREKVWLVIIILVVAVILFMREYARRAMQTKYFPPCDWNNDKKCDEKDYNLILSRPDQCEKDGGYFNLGEDLNFDKCITSEERLKYFSQAHPEFQKLINSIRNKK